MLLYTGLLCLELDEHIEKSADLDGDSMAADVIIHCGLKRMSLEPTSKL